MAVDIDDLFRRASAAVESGNYEYAIEYFRDILRADPNHVKARMAMRGCCRKQFDEKGGSAKVVGVLKGLWPMIRILLATGKPNKQIEACEDYLRHDPYNRSVLMKLGLAARQAGHIDLATFVFEDIRNRHPGFIPALRQLGEIFEEDQPDVKKAIQYYSEIAALAPTDANIQKKLKDLNARMHMEATKLEERKSFTELVRDKEKQKELLEKDREQTIVRSDDEIMEEIKRIQEKLKEDPTSISHLKRLGQLFDQKKDVKRAIAAYKKVLEIKPDDYEAKSRIGDIMIRNGRQNLKALEEKLAADPDNADLKAKVEAGRKQLAEFRVKEFAWRTEAHPTDLRLKADYGDALYDAGRIDEAIQQYQRALEDVRIRTNMRIALGKCFMAKEQYDLAIGQFERALEDFTFLTDDAKETHYSLGQCAEAMGDIDKALTHYKTIYETDIAFRDVATRIDKLTKKQKEQQASSSQ